MPELPEVETVKEVLRSQIIGEKIIDVTCYYEPMLENIKEKDFVVALKGETLRRIERYAKYLIFIFDHVSIVSHLRMEGKFFIKSKLEKVALHEHIIFTFESNRTLRYHDTRKFGKMALLKTTDLSKIMEYPSLKKLGPEANNPDITPDYLYQKLHNKSMPIKTALLDQEIISGIGNIYADEICFHCQLSPKMTCKKIKMEDVVNILAWNKKVLNNAIKEGGTTIRSYTSSLGATGRFQQYLYVHAQEGKKCKICGNLIQKTIVGGRGTSFCPFCQRERRPLIIGLTGGIASGKSTVTNYLKNNYQVVDADEIVKSLYQKKEIITLISNEFGHEYINNNQINRKKLGYLIFNDEIARMRLNSLIHPLVFKTIQKEIENSLNDIIFLDVPLLYETNFDQICDKIIVVYCQEKINIERLCKRDMITYEEAVKKISTQENLQKKAEKSHFIIDNSQDICYTYKQIENILKSIIK